MSRGAKRFNRTDSSLVALAVQSTPFAGTCALCALLLFGLRVKPPPPFPEQPHDDTRCVLVDRQSTAGTPSWMHQFYDWAWLRDPTLLVLPDEVRGFSAVRKRKLHITPTNVPEYTFAVSPEKEQPATPVRISPAPVPLTEKLVTAWIPAPPPPVEPRIIQPFARGIFWRRHDGQPLDDAPDVPLAAVRDAIGEAGLPKYPTSIRVSRPETSRIARIHVTRGCGNPVLDRLAVQAVRRTVGAYELKLHTADTADRPPSLLPNRGQSTEFEVEWSVPVEPTL